MPSVKNIGKPYAGKLHVRFDEGGQAERLLSTLPRTLRQLRRINLATAFLRQQALSALPGSRIATLDRQVSVVS